MLVECNIPIAKSECPAFQAFIERYCHEPMSSRWSLSHTMEKESKVNMNKVKERLQDQRLFVLVDETTDRWGRAMTAVLSGPLDGRFKDWPFLLDLLDIHAANNKNSTGHLDYNSLHLLITDGATYCLKAGRGLKELFLNMMHVACICHALNRVAELVRYEFPLVDELISEIKKVLAVVKAKKLFKDPKLPGQLAFIKGNFTQLVRAISSLQERLPLTESIEILERVQIQLTVEPFSSKLNS
ncbi:Putative LOC100902024, partial [Caligus rogercresseyi]